MKVRKITINRFPIQLHDAYRLLAMEISRKQNKFVSMESVMRYALEHWIEGDVRDLSGEPAIEDAQEVP